MLQMLTFTKFMRLHNCIHILDSNTSISSPMVGSIYMIVQEPCRSIIILFIVLSYTGGNTVNSIIAMK